jgi:hypothetical protein
MQELFGDNPQVRKLRDDYMTQVIRKDLQETILVEDASRNFRKISKKKFHPSNYLLRKNTHISAKYLCIKGHLFVLFRTRRYPTNLHVLELTTNHKNPQYYFSFNTISRFGLF